ncbi:TetR/AcrR family transcriptional regulator [Lentilitoribacter sp. EG35]|uniref:TetR/AcrR family transcriptional regulator n=1 Tax=Lentilitoribacter sp. EG35 TaxID=3234192 RepID=UPI00345FA48C
MARSVGSDGKITAAEIRKNCLVLFARNGYAAVSMRQIAQSVGVQASAIYQYFENKQQILVDLLQTHMEKLLEAWDAEMCRESAPKALERFIRFHIRYHIKKPDEVFVSYMELRSLEPEGFKTIESLRRKYEQVLKSILEEGAADGSLNVDDPHVAAMAILSMLTGVNTWYRSGGRLSQDRIEDIYAAMVLRSQGVMVSSENNEELAHV